MTTTVTTTPTAPGNPGTGATPDPEKPKKELAQTSTLQIDFAATDVVWNVYGLGFGETPGGVSLNGKVLEIVRWADRRIKGIMPKDAKPGPVVIITSSGIRHIAQFGKQS